jgi:hypothetical protein
VVPFVLYDRGVKKFLSLSLIVAAAFMAIGCAQPAEGEPAGDSQSSAASPSSDE